jgi:hypothetical protein
MPTINMYQDGDGYYIRARPSDATGTITYKIRSYGNPVVRETDFKDGEEITWDSISALKSLGIVYTDGSGTVAPDDFNPDSELLQKNSISEQKARRMLTAVRKHLEMDKQQLQDAADALGISYNQNGDENQPFSPIDTEEGSTRQLSTTDAEESPYTLVSSAVRYDELEPGQKYVGRIDRISGSGNGIIELSGGFVNIGECARSDVGNRVVFVFSEGTFCDVVGGISQPNTTTEKTSHDLGEYLNKKDRRLLDKL